MPSSISINLATNYTTIISLEYKGKGCYKLPLVVYSTPLIKDIIEIISCLDQGLVMADAKITVLSCMADCFFHISGFDRGFA